MARPTISGTRAADTITVVDNGVTVNGTLKPFSASIIDGGFVIKGNAGNDTLTGGRGADSIYGGAGNDRLTGGSGFDHLYGGDGADTLIDGPVGATFDGGRGIDTIDLSAAAAGVFVDLGSRLIDDDITVTVLSDGRLNVTGYGDAVLAITAVENVTGSNFNDVLWGGSAANTINGRSGTDELFGQAGADKLFGGAGDDYMGGGSGNDQLTGGTGRDSFLFASGSAAGAGEGHDTIYDYTPGEDVLVFQWSQHDLVWSSTVVNGQNSLVGTYDGGRSEVILVGITDLADVTIIHSDYNWTFGSA